MTTDELRRYNRDWQRKRRLQCRSEGICINCKSRPMTSGNKTCSVCRERMRQYWKGYALKKTGAAS